jgi:hypothetical protein
MQLDDLFESPQYIPIELPINLGEFISFCSNDTLLSDYHIIGDGTNSDNKFQVAIRKSESFAFIGIPGLRDRDNKPGIKVVGSIEFQYIMKLSGTTSIINPKNALQVRLVDVSDRYKRLGWGFELYLSLAKAGYTVISDNTQYIGGKALWKKIAKLSVNSQYQVFVLDNYDLIVLVNQ